MNTEGLDKLKEQIKEEKLSTFDFLWDLARLERKDLDNAGYRGKSAAEAVKMALEDSAKKIEKMVVAWEKAHPDD